MTTDDQAVACHWLLLNIAGSAPDELLTQGRTWLAEGRRAELARAVGQAVFADQLNLSDDDMAVLAQLLLDAGADPSVLATIEPDDLEPTGMHGFAPTRAQTDALLSEIDASEAAPAELANTDEPEDGIDQAAISAAAAESAALALWRAWRFPGDGAHWPAPPRIYVLETGPDGDLVAIAARVQAAIAAAGETAPQVEVYPLGAGPPQYQRMARGYGGLVWARVADPGGRMAVLFDGVDPQTGPYMDPGHPVVEAAEAQRLLGYLRGGEAVLVTPARMDDIVDTSQTAKVPMNFITDGYWIWTDAMTYYLDRHSLRPDPELVAHIEARDYAIGEIDGAGIHRALRRLQQPAAEEAAWTYG